MSTELQQRYRALLSRLLFEREAAGGELSEEEESHFVALLDDVWWQLTAEEQNVIDGELITATVAAPLELDLFDCAVLVGESVLPRRKAA